MNMSRLAGVLLALTMTTPALAARCGGDFNSFLASMSTEAHGAGVSLGTAGSTVVSSLAVGLAGRPD